MNKRGVVGVATGGVVGAAENAPTPAESKHVKLAPPMKPAQSSECVSSTSTDSRSSPNGHVVNANANDVTNNKKENKDGGK